MRMWTRLRDCATFELDSQQRTIINCMYTRTRRLVASSRCNTAATNQNSERENKTHSQRRISLRLSLFLSNPPWTELDSPISLIMELSDFFLAPFETAARPPSSHYYMGDQSSYKPGLDGICFICITTRFGHRMTTGNGIIG